MREYINTGKLSNRSVYAVIAAIIVSILATIGIVLTMLKSENPEVIDICYDNDTLEMTCRDSVAVDSVAFKMN